MPNATDLHPGGGGERRACGDHHGEEREDPPLPLVPALAGGRAVLALLATREGRKVAGSFPGWKGSTRRFCPGAPNPTPARWRFSPWTSPARGMGLGKRLFQAVMDNMRQEGIGTVFLFTDTSCNYGFYEHQGMVRRAEQTQRIWLGQESGEMTFFVYDYTLDG